MIEATLRYLHFLGARRDDDNIDRLHYFLTSNLLIVLSLLISYKQFGGRPIECATPKMFPKSWEDVIGFSLVKFLYDQYYDCNLSTRKISAGLKTHILLRWNQICQAPI